MLLNQNTLDLLNGFISNPTTSLLIDSNGDQYAPDSIIEKIHEKLVNSKNNPLIVLDIEEKKSIGVEEIRSLKKSINLVANRGSGISRIVIIKNASLLTVEAQNSLLKLIEELPERTMIILVCIGLNDIISTIQSRCFILRVLPISLNQANKYGIDQGIESELVFKLYALSEGKPGVFQYLIRNSEDISLQIDFAKNFLSSNIIERQLIIEDIIKNPEEVSIFLNNLKIVAKAGMENSKQINQKSLWKTILVSIINTEKLIKQNTPVKLALMSLNVSI